MIDVKILLQAEKRRKSKTKQKKQNLRKNIKLP